MKNLLTILLGLTTFIAEAHDFEIEGIYYDVMSIPNLTCEIVGGNPGLTNLTLPATIEVSGRTLKVVSINTEAWKGDQNITSLVISDGIETIEKSAFSSCENLSNVKLGNIKIIEDEAFYGCDNLKDITIPGSTTSIGNQTFATNQEAVETNLVFQYGIENLSFGTDILINRVLNTIDIDRDITQMGDQWNTTNETTIKWGPNATIFPSYVGKEMTECDLSTTNIKIISDNAFSAKLENIKLPMNLDSIGREAFHACSIKDITFPNTLRAIGYRSFSSCPNITKVQLPNSIKYVGDNAFANCDALQEAHVEPLVNIPWALFYNCDNLTNVYMSDDVTSIGAYAFSYSQIRSIKLPKSLKTISSSSFAYCNALEEFTIPSTVETVEDDAFEDCHNLSKFIIEYSDKPLYFKESVYKSTQITTTSWKDSEEEAHSSPGVRVYYLQSPFMLDSITDLELNREVLPCPPEQIPDDDKPDRFIRYYVESNNYYEYMLYFPNSNLERIEIGEYSPNPFTANSDTTFSYTHIEYESFYYGDLGKRINNNSYTYSQSLSPTNLTNIKEINISNSIPPILDADFPDKIYIKAILNVPIGAKEAYEKTPYWKNFWNINEIDFESGIETIENTNNTLPSIVGVYDINGRKVTDDHKGITIIKYSDGKVRKIVTR